MRIQKTKFDKEIPLKIQINNLKKTLIETRVVLGKKFTLDIAIIIIQVEKLIDYYNSKKLTSRFKSYSKSLELLISREDLPFNDTSMLLKEFNYIKTEFSSSTNNIQKKEIMFKLLFFHIDILFSAYQMLEPKNDFNKIEKNSFKTVELDKIPSISAVSETNESLERLNPKQKKKYLKLKDELAKETNPVKANKIRASLHYYKKLKGE